MPIILKIIIKPVSENIVFLLLIEILPKKEVIFDSLSFLISLLVT